MSKTFIQTDSDINLIVLIVTLFKMIGNTCCSRRRLTISSNMDSRLRSWTISGDGTGTNPRKLLLDMAQVCRRAHLWLCSSVSVDFSVVDGLSDACVSETARRFLLRRAW